MESDYCWPSGLNWTARALASDYVAARSVAFLLKDIFAVHSAPSFHLSSFYSPGQEIDLVTITEFTPTRRVYILADPTARSNRCVNRTSERGEESCYPLARPLVKIHAATGG